MGTETTYYVHIVLALRLPGVTVGRRFLTFYGFVHPTIDPCIPIHPIVNLWRM